MLLPASSFVSILFPIQSKCTVHSVEYSQVFIRYNMMHNIIGPESFPMFTSKTTRNVGYPMVNNL